MVPAVPLSVWSVLELVRTSELRHSVNLLGVSLDSSHLLRRPVCFSQQQARS